MPELPEVETVRRGLAPVMEGAMIACVDLRRNTLRYPFPENFKQRLEGASIRIVSRRAKYILVFAKQPDSLKEEVLILHLGMSGRFKIIPSQNGNAATDFDAAFHHSQATYDIHDHVIFHLSSGVRIVYNDARRFGFMDLVAADDYENSPYLKRLGLEPLSNAMNADALAKLFYKRKTSLKAALLDQRFIAGLGNIYVCEALFRAHLHPNDPASILANEHSLPTSAAERLAPVIVDVLKEAVEAGGSTLRDFAHTDGAMGYFQHAFQVYDREGKPCVRDGCQSHIKRMTQNGRSTYFCALCQTEEA
jgi:formamidopyrimidine-DNA glycosylase